MNISSFTTCLLLVKFHENSYIGLRCLVLILIDIHHTFCLFWPLINVNVIQWISDSRGGLFQPASKCFVRVPIQFVWDVHEVLHQLSGLFPVVCQPASIFSLWISAIPLHSSTKLNGNLYWKCSCIVELLGKPRSRLYIIWNFEWMCILFHSIILLNTISWFACLP